MSWAFFSLHWHFQAPHPFTSLLSQPWLYPLLVEDPSGMEQCAESVSVSSHCVVDPMLCALKERINFCEKPCLVLLRK